MLERWWREVEAGHYCAEFRPRKRVRPDVAIEMKQCLASHVPNVRFVELDDGADGRRISDEAVDWVSIGCRVMGTRSFQLSQICLAILVDRH